MAVFLEPGNVVVMTAHADPPVASSENKDVTHTKSHEVIQPQSTGFKDSGLAPSIVEELCRSGHLKLDDLNEEDRQEMQSKIAVIVAEALERSQQGRTSRPEAYATDSGLPRTRVVSCVDPEDTVSVRHSVSDVLDSAMQTGAVVTSALVTSWAVTALSNANLGSLTLAVVVNIACYFTGDAAAKCYVQSRDFALEVLQWTARCKLETLGIEAGLGIVPCVRSLYFSYWSDDFTETEMDGYIVMHLLQNKQSRTPEAMERAQEFVRTSFRAMALEAHPDRGGSSEQFVALTEAKDWLLDALAEAAADLPESVPESCELGQEH